MNHWLFSKKRTIKIEVPEIRLNTSFIYLLISLFVWCYLWIKAFIIPLYFDEITTFYIYVQPNRFLPFIAHMDANNHLLNSTLTSLFYDLFGSHPVILRLSNLLFFPVYAFYAYRLLTFFKKEAVRWIFFLTMVLSLYFVDFFFVCRGYGMSMALLTASIYYTLHYTREPTVKSFTCALLAAGFSAFANLTLVYYFITLLGVLLLQLCGQYRKLLRKYFFSRLALLLFLGVFPLGILALYSSALGKAGLLVLGQEGNFIETTVQTVIYCITGGITTFSKYYTFFIFLASGILILFLQFKNRFRIFFSIESVVYYQLIGIISIILILHAFQNIHFPIFRAGIFLFPLILISAATVIDRVMTVSRNSLPVLALIPFLIIPLSSLYGIQLSSSILFEWETNVPERFYFRMMEEQEKSHQRLVFGGSDLRKWYYYNYRNQNKLDAVNTWNFPGSTEDFQLVSGEELTLFNKQYEVVDYDLTHSAYLLKRKHLMKRHFLEKQSNAYPVETRSEFFNLFEKKLDSLNLSNLLFQFELSILSKNIPCEIILVAQINDKNRNHLLSGSINLNWLHRSFRQNSGKVCNSILIEKIPENAHSATVYLFNPQKRKVLISGSCSYYTLRE